MKLNLCDAMNFVKACAILTFVVTQIAKNIKNPCFTYYLFSLFTLTLVTVTKFYIASREVS